jgi:ABC-type phosphate transport system substrate-binding protein
VVLNDGSGPSADVASLPQVTRQQLCQLFNGDNPTINGVNYTQGVRRADGSGTTFLVSQHLSAVCSSLGLWQTAAGVNRGFGQVSVPDTNPACATAPDIAGTPAIEGTRSNTVCWPASFLSGSGNPGVASTTNGAGVGAFGYVEFATAASLQPIPGNAAPVDTDLVLANNPSPRAFGNLDIARVQNLSGNFVPPLAGNVQFALADQYDEAVAPNASCRLVINAPDPANAQGYPIVGVNYLLFYGDYNPDVVPGGGNPIAIGAFNNRGATLSTRYRQLVQYFNQGPGRQIQIDFGYAPLPTVIRPDSPTTPQVENNSLATESTQTAIRCINAQPGLTAFDAPPPVAP